MNIRTKLLKLAGTLLFLSVPAISYAGPIHFLLESDNDRQGGSEVFLSSFADFQDLLDGTLSSGTFSQLDVGPNFSAGGLAYDGTNYQLLLESDDDRQSGSEVFLASFTNFQDLLDGTLSSSSFSQLDIGPNFSAGGLAYDGTNYQLLLESDDDRQSGSEVFLASFADFQDLLDGTLSSSSFSQLDIGPNFSAGGLAYDGMNYQLLLESDDDRQGGSEVFLASFAGFQELLDGTLSSSSFSQLDIGPNFSGGGLVVLPDHPVEVPEPSSIGLLGAGLLGLIWARRKRVDSSLS